jgi:Fe(3+) dicitrate transport protein
VSRIHILALALVAPTFAVAAAIDDQGPSTPSPSPEAVAEAKLHDRIQVVGTSEDLDLIPGAVHVIGHEELERQGVVDIHRAVRRIPGFSLQEEDGYGLRPNLGLRGSGVERSSRIALLEDGILTAPAPYSAPAAYYSPTMGRIEGLEVLKGASAITQGPYTVGGVVNYLSTSIPGQRAARFALELGEDGHQRQHLWAGDSGERFGWLLEGHRLATDGFKRLDGGGDTGFELVDFTGKARWTSAPGARVAQSVELKLGRSEQDGDETYLGLSVDDFEADPLRRYAASANDHIDVEHEQISLRWLVSPAPNVDITTVVYRHETFRLWSKLENVAGVSISSILADPNRYSTQLGVVRGELDSAPGDLRLRNNRREYYAEGVQSVLGWRPVESHQIELGLRWHADAEDRFQEDDRWQMVDGRLQLTTLGAPGSQDNRIGSATAWSAFLRDRIELGRLTLVPGIRFESIDLLRRTWTSTDPGRALDPTRRESTVDVWIPGLGAHWRLSDAAGVFFGVHRGFAPPGPGSAAEVEAEESINWELGWRAQRDGARAEVVAFFHDYDNLLGADTLAGGGTGTGDQFNGGAVEVSGLEASASWSLQLGGWQLPMRASWTFNQGEFQSSFTSSFADWSPRVERGDELPYLPEHQLWLGLGLERGRVAVDLDLSWQDEMRTKAGSGPIAEAERIESRFVTDLSARIALPHQLELVARVRNLFDETYVAARRPAGLRPGLPRTAIIGLSWKL